MQKSSISITNFGTNLTDERRARNAFYISIGTAILLSLLLVVTIIVNRSFTKDLAAIISLTAGAVIFGVSAWLSRNKNNDLGMILNISVLTLIIASRVFVQKGLALPIGIVYIILITSLAVYTLPPKWMGRVVAAAFIVALFTITVDQFTVGIPTSPSAGFVTWIAAFVGIIYLFILAAQFQYLSLRTKLIFGFLFLAITPLISLGYLTYVTSQAILQADLLQTPLSDLIQSQTRNIVITSVIIASVAALIALVASNFFTKPITQLTRVAEKISSGDLTQKANIQQFDEIGILARTFNTMLDQIQELIGNLEKRVDERTAKLAETTSQSEKRAQDLQTIAEIARHISTEKDIEKLLQLVTRTVSERFGFYHVGIFLLNENMKFAFLRAANSPGGQVMLRRQHKLEVGYTGIVGNVTSTGIPRIALDTGADAIYFNNPDLPETRSEMALPLIARGTIIGALDVQSTIPNAFTATDITIISLLADQVAIAIDNMRLLENSQKALAESQSAFHHYLSESWQKKSESGVIGYYQTHTGGKLITANNRASEIDETAGQENGTLAIPILVRDQIIGTLNIRSNNESKTWNEDEINIAQAVTERLGLALDNARLFEETSTRASRERMVADITTRIRGTNDPQEMIKTAVEELQRVLGATRVEIVPQKISAPPDK